MKKIYVLFIFLFTNIHSKSISQSIAITQPNKLELYNKIFLIFDSKNKFNTSQMIKIVSTLQTLNNYSDTISKKMIFFETTKKHFNILEQKKNSNDTLLIVSNGAKLKTQYKGNKKITDASKIYMIFGHLLGIPTLLEALKDKNTSINLENNRYKIIYNDKNNNQYIYKININTLLLESCETSFWEATYQNYQIVNELYIPSQIIKKLVGTQIITEIQEIQLFEKIDESLFVIED